MLNKGTSSTRKINANGKFIWCLKKQMLIESTLDVSKSTIVAIE